tara:strand:+ start:638 stop:790 length:153 start_codon:yes stop_codon:yes gene_type:complete
MELSVIIEELRQAYMEQNWESILECINLLSDFNENNTESISFQEDTYGDD